MLKNTECSYSLEPPEAGLTSTDNLCFEQQYEQNIRAFICKKNQLLVVKFSIYLNKRVVVMSWAHMSECTFPDVAVICIYFSYEYDVTNGSSNTSVMGDIYDEQLLRAGLCFQLARDENVTGRLLSTFKFTVDSR